MNDENQDKGFDLDLSPQELQEMLTSKTIENAKLLEELATAKNELVNLKTRSLKVYEENELLKADPEVRKLRAMMNYKLDMAKRFIASGAFPKGMTPEQAYTIMQAGAEMGMKEVEALNSLYITNGAIDYHGKAMTAKFREKGYAIEYLDENNNGVTVRVYNEQTGEDYKEIVRRDDQILQKSRAMTFAAKNKMRFHGLRAIMAFHLAHHFGSVSDPFQSYAHDQIDILEQQKQIGTQTVEAKREQLLKFITNPRRTAEQLQSVYNEAIELGLESEIQSILDNLKTGADEQE